MTPRHKLQLTLIICTCLLIALSVIGSGCGASDGSNSDRLLGTPSPEVTPGLVVYGYVRDLSGVGVANVDIYRSYSAYPGELIATTDPGGHYESALYYIPGDEMVTVWAEQLGVEFDPESYHWQHYYGYERTERNFSVRNPMLGYLSK